MGEFSGLPVNMNLKTVKEFAQKGGVGLDGVKIKISRDPDLIGKNVFGHASSDGKVITLYPDAFSSPENLIRTLGHERTHIFQFKTLGSPDGVGVGGHAFERAALDAEDSFIQFWKANGGN